MKNDIPNIPNYLLISDANLLQYEFHHIVINFTTRFPWHFEINLRWLLLEDFFCGTQKMHISEYICKTCLKELGILLKCRETFEKFIVAWNSAKNTGFPHFFQRFLTTVFKEFQFPTKNQKVLLCCVYEFKTN